MIVTLDGERLKGEFPHDSLQTLVDEVRRVRLGDRLVVSVTLDGQLLLDQELSERLSQPLEQVTQVDLASADPHELASAALREVAGQLATAADSQTAVADQLRTGAVAEAATAFGDFLQVWQTCQRAVVECSGLLGEDLTATQSGGKAVREHLDGLADRLRELRDALLLSDLFQYEMPETCKTWQGILNDLATNLADRAGAPAS
jgi:hypothetical protein